MNRDNIDKYIFYATLKFRREYFFRGFSSFFLFFKRFIIYYIT